MTFKILSSKERKEIVKVLESQFGISSVDYILIQAGKDKIRAFSAEITKDEIIKLSREVRIEILGIYFAKIEEGGIRLSIDATNLLKEQITKNILELNDSQALDWMRGKSIEVDSSLQGFKVIKHNGDFLGTGKTGSGILYNFVPKDRRIRN